MSKRTVLPIGTQRFERRFVIRVDRIFPRNLVGLTELTLISTGMVQLFNAVMRVRAIEIGAAFFAGFLALRVIVTFEVGPAVVVLVVVAETEIFVMGI